MIGTRGMKICTRGMGTIGALTLAAAMLLMPASGFARGKDKAGHNERERAVMAADVLQSAMTGEDHQIPDALLRQAQGIAVIPHVVKGALMVGGQYGKGLVSQRQADGTWTPPAYISVGGASYGFQVGVQAVDLILVFVGRDAIQKMMKDNLKLGATASVTAGPIGRSAEASTDIKLNTGIYSYSRTRGAFAGVALDGAVLSFDNDANAMVYGKGVKGSELVAGEGALKPAPDVEPFVQALQHLPNQNVSERSSSAE